MHLERLWVPINLRKEERELLVDWIEVAPDFREPFFDQTIYNQVRERSCARRTTSAANLKGEVGSHRPSGLIFHMSRCGSTLVAQMLSGVHSSIVLSEPSIIDRILRENSCSKRALLGSMVTALAAPFSENHSVVIKFTARAITEYDVIRGAVPEVPGVFLYRDPVEVLVSLIGQSHERLPPGLASAGLLPIDINLVKDMRPAEFWARVIARQCEAGLNACQEGGSRIRLLNYTQLPEVVWQSVAGFFGFTVTSTDSDRMSAIASRYAKQPQRLFESDAQTKRRGATAEIEDAAEEFVYVHYRALESARLRAALPGTAGAA